LNRRLFSIAHYAAIVVLVAGLCVVGGCDEPEVQLDIKSLIESAVFQQATTNDAATALDTLVYYINLYPDLEALMTGSVAHTFFAPSNAAFQKLKTTTGFPTNPDALKLLNKSMVANVLKYHFSEGKKMRSELTAGLVLDSKFTDPLAATAPQKITVNGDGTLKASPLAANVAIAIKIADAEATNGVVHVVEAVMVPPSTGEVLFPSLGQVAGGIILTESFSNLTRVLQYADAGFVEDQVQLKLKVTNWLAMPTNTTAVPTANLKGITFFAPPNAAGTTPIFTKEKADAVIALGKEGARNFLLNHLVVDTPSPNNPQEIGQYIVGTPPASNPDMITKFAQGQSIYPLRGTAKRIFVNIVQASLTVPTGVEISNAIDSTPPAPTSFKPILLGDQKAKNGYYHVIRGALE